MLGEIHNESLMDKLTLILEGEGLDFDIEMLGLCISITLKQAQRKILLEGRHRECPAREAPQLCSGLSSGLGTCADFRANILDLEAF